MSMMLNNQARDPLTLAQIKKLAPSAFSKSADPSVSESYGFISTATMIEALMDAKFVPVDAKQNRAKGDAGMFTRHMVTFRRAGDLRRIQKVGDAIPQIMLMNAHNRQSAFHIYAGAYRMVCSNGMVIANGELGHAKVRHSLEGAQQAVQIANSLIESADGAFAAIETMQKTKTDEKLALKYASDALKLAFPDSATIIDPNLLLTPRRKEDDTKTIWNMFNVVQENVMRGGLEGKSATGRTTKTRGITRIFREVETNKALWENAVALLPKAA